MSNQVIKRMNNIHSSQHYDGDTLLVGTDEMGNDFTIVFDSYDLLKWIDIKEIKEALIKHINHIEDEK